MNVVDSTVPLVRTVQQFSPAFDLNHIAVFEPKDGIDLLMGAGGISADGPASGFGATIRPPVDPDFAWRVAKGWDTTGTVNDSLREKQVLFYAVETEPTQRLVLCWHIDGSVSTWVRDTPEATWRKFESIPPATPNLPPLFSFKYIMTGLGVTNNDPAPPSLLWRLWGSNSAVFEQGSYSVYAETSMYIPTQGYSPRTLLVYRGALPEQAPVFDNSDGPTICLPSYFWRLDDSL